MRAHCRKQLGTESFDLYVGVRGAHDDHILGLLKPECRLKTAISVPLLL